MFRQGGSLGQAVWEFGRRKYCFNLITLGLQMKYILCQVCRFQYHFYFPSDEFISSGWHVLAAKLKTKTCFHEIVFDASN